MIEVPEAKTAAASSSTFYVALTGNPNCGKTTLFNALTGLRAKVGNYAGVTVERKEGRMLGTVPPRAVTILDLPGTYSLSPQSLDEEVSRDVLFNRLPDVPAPRLVVIVVDASNLQRNLYYATQVIELGYPTIIALNMVDVAEVNGQEVDADGLREELGVPVFPLVASRNIGLTELRQGILEVVANSARPGGPMVARERLPRFSDLPEPVEREAGKLAEVIQRTGTRRPVSVEAESLLLLTDERVSNTPGLNPDLLEAIRQARARLENEGVDWRTVTIEGRYGKIAEIEGRVCNEASAMLETFSDKLDRVLTHKLWGMLIFVAIMGLMFQSIFTLAQYPMDWIDAGVSALGSSVGAMIPPGDLHSLLVDGVIAGVGAVVVFLPQICLLFLFIGLLEDTGYMARAAFLMDRLMSKVGLHGKSFIPMLSSFACAIPGIMATRTIESPKDRLVTILVAPLMSCSARLPVYTLLIAACIPNKKAFGFLKLSGLTMLAMYLLGIIMALLMAWLFKKTLLRSETPLLIMELPPYKKPVLRVVMRHMWDRSRLFLRRAGTVILGISILLWFLATYPRMAAVEQEFAVRRQTIEKTALDASTRHERLLELDKQQSGERLRTSFAGRLGRFIEPAIAPLGFDWKMGIGIVSSFAAREVFVSTMSTVYNMGAAGRKDVEAESLGKVLQEQRHPDGSPIYTTLVGITLMVFYVLALQCVSTVAVVRRETNSWKWPIFQWAYMGALAWIMAFITYQGGRFLGFQ